jgi:hypothetical protein
MNTRKQANPKEPSTSVPDSPVPDSPKDRNKTSDHEKLMAVSREYYAKNEVTSPLEALVIAVMGTESVKSQWEYSKPDGPVFEDGAELTYELLEYELGALWERFEWTPRSDMLRHVGSLVAKGDTKGLQEFASAQASYEEGLTDLAYKERARLFLMVACETLRSRYRAREEVLKAEVRDLACELWANYNLNRSRTPHTAENIRHARKRLPKVDWPLIFKEVGLRDLAEAKRGWKQKGNAKR